MPVIVFVHGMYLNGESWQPWIDRAAARGHDSLAPSWPFHDGDPAQLRATIRPGLGRLTFGAVVDYLKAVIDALPEPPVLVGHSIGGLAVQKLLHDGYGRAAVAISSAPPQGVLTLAPDFFRANWPHVNPFAGSRPIEMTRERFHWTFCTTMTRADSDARVRPLRRPGEPERPAIDPHRSGAHRLQGPHPPLLMLAGDTDHLTPEHLVRRNAARYTQPVEVRTFPGRAHFICNQPGWEEVADAAFEWIDDPPGSDGSRLG